MRNPLVTLTLESNHTVNIELYPEVALNTVSNFIHLVQEGFYNGLILHRVIPAHSCKFDNEEALAHQNNQKIQ